MDGAPRRFSGFPFAQGLLVLDEVTGEVVLVTPDGAAPKQLRPPLGPITTPTLESNPVVAAPTSFRDPRAALRAVVSPEPPPLSAQVVSIGRPPESSPMSSSGGARYEVALTELDREVIATFPYPVATVYARLFAETDPRQQCRLLVDTFATLLKLWALLLASEYLAKETRDAALNELLARDFSRPLISVWHLFTQRALAVFRAEKTGLFASELATAYDLLETKCKTPFMAKTRFEDAKGEVRTRESKLGKIQALIKYRNGLAHGYNLPPARASQHLATYLPVLREILEQARFMTRYPLHGVAPQPGGALAAVALVGARPSGRPETIDVTSLAAQHPLFFWDPEKKRMLGLGALAVLEPPEDQDHAIEGLGRDVFLFEGNTRSAVTYASALGEHVEKQSHAALWRAALEPKAVDVAVLRRDDLDLDKLRVPARRVTNATLDALVRVGKYVSEVAYRPPYVRERLSQLELGSARGVVFVGDSGSGKSTLAASIAEEKTKAGDVVLFYRAASLLDGDLQARVARDLGLRDLFFEDFLSAAERCFDGGARMWIVVDSVNEHPGDVAALVGSIDAMVRQAAEHPWLRVVVTARTAAYERLPADARFGRLEGARWLATEERHGSETRTIPLVPLLPLTTEEVGEIYERYRAWRPVTTDEAPASQVQLRCRPNTDFKTLAERGRSTVAMMRSPLMMRLLLAAFHGRDLDPELSFDEAMRLYFEQVVVGQGERGAASWERGSFLKTLVAELDAVSSDTIERDACHQVPALKRHVQNAQKDSPYVQLLDLGVLTEHWDRDRCFVRFGFDRLFEFLLADLHERTCSDAYGVLDLLRRSPKFGGLVGALVVALARQCAAGKPETLLAAVRLADSLPGDAPERTSARVVGREVVERVARQPAELERLTNGLVAAPTALGGSILLEAFERLFRQGEVASAQTVIDAACAIAEARRDARLLEDAVYARGRIQQQRGELDGALASFARVAELATDGGNFVAAHRAAVKQAEIFLSRGAQAEAARLLEAAIPALRAAGALADAAEARRQEAIAAQRKNQLDDARRLAEDAAAIAREARDPNAEASCLVTCGITAWKKGDLAAATRFYEQAMRLSEHEGNMRTMASIAGNLGLLARDRGEYAAAAAWIEKQLAASQRMEHRPWIASALHNLGVLRIEAGDVGGAEKTLLEARRVWAEQGNGLFAAACTTLLAYLGHERGEDVAALLDDALELAEKADAPDARADALWLHAQYAIASGMPDANERAERFAKASDGSERRAAQIAALELMRLVREGRAAERRTAELATTIRAAFDGASPLPELYELPLQALADLADACAAAGDDERAAHLRDAARGWLRGRPHHLTRALTGGSALRTTA